MTRSRPAGGSRRRRRLPAGTQRRENVSSRVRRGGDRPVPPRCCARPGPGWNTAWLARGTAARASLPRSARSAWVSRPSPVSRWYRNVPRGGAPAVSTLIIGSSLYPHIRVAIIATFCCHPLIAGQAGGAYSGELPICSLGHFVPHAGSAGSRWTSRSSSPRFSILWRRPCRAAWSAPARRSTVVSPTVLSSVSSKAARTQEPATPRKVIT
jgi:hypothetical protein